MTRATLLATTTAILLPISGVLAQGVDTGAGVGSGASGGGISASAETEGAASVEGDTATHRIQDTAEAASDAVDQAGEAVTSTAEDLAEGAEDTLDDVSDTLTPEAETTAAAEIVTVGDITGAEVVDAAGDVVGSVEMVAEQSDGKVAVIGVGGFLGIGEHDVAIPAGDLTYDAEGRLRLDGYTEADLRQRPAFDDTDAVELAADVELPEIG